MNHFKKHITGIRFTFLVLTGLVLMAGHPLLHAFERSHLVADELQHEQPFGHHDDVPVEDCLECILASASAFESAENVTFLKTDIESFLKPGIQIFPENSSKTGFSLRAPPMPYV